MHIFLSDSGITGMHQEIFKKNFENGIKLDIEKCVKSFKTSQMTKEPNIK